MLPHQAIRLFDGKTLAGWTARKPSAVTWRVVDDALEVVAGAGDLHTGLSFTDFQLHLEFWLPHLPWATGQQRANSGVYLQGKYELQLLDSSGKEQPADDDCGALYKVAAPLLNACRPPEQWQSLDVAFRAPRVDLQGTVTRPGSLTVLMNGLCIHHDVPLTAPTKGGLPLPPGDPGPILLQDHGDAVRFRDLWVLPLSLDNV